MYQTGECRQQKHAQHAPSTKMECDYLCGWTKKNGHIRNNLAQMVKPRAIAGNAEKEEDLTTLGIIWPCISDPRTKRVLR